MNSSYFAVPGRGGASAGIPPAQTGIASLTPAASFSLMVPHPLSAKPASESAMIMAIWRGGVGDEKTVKLIAFMRVGFGARFGPPPADGFFLSGAIYFSQQTK